MKKLALSPSPTTWRIALMIVSLCLLPALVRADVTDLVTGVSGIRVSFATQKFEGGSQLAVAFQGEPPAWTKADRMEMAVGANTWPGNVSPFVSLGPVWRRHTSGGVTYMEFGISPTLLEETEYGDRDMGGNFHFTSSFSVGRPIPQLNGSAILLRIQHTSNGGLNSRNPGMDMIGITFTANLN
ncbi:MAG: acyloxyacyl hydrolase [Pseudomonadota bacterium]